MESPVNHLNTLDWNQPDAQGHFGPFGGRYVPETLMHPLKELEDEYFRAQTDPAFQDELSYYLKEFVGRPTPLYFAERLTRELGIVTEEEQAPDQTRSKPRRKPARPHDRGADDSSDGDE